MKKLILLSLTLGLTFPASHVLAGGLFSKPAKVIENAADKPENNNNAKVPEAPDQLLLTNLPPEMLAKLFDYIIQAYFYDNNVDTSVNAKTINSLPLIFKGFNSDVISYLINNTLENRNLDLQTLQKLAKLHYRGIPKILRKQLKELLKNNDPYPVISDFLSDPALHNKTEKQLLKPIDNYVKDRVPDEWVPKISAITALKSGKINLTTKILGTRHHQALERFMVGLFIAAPVSAVVSGVGNWYLGNSYLTPILYWFF